MEIKRLWHENAEIRKGIGTFAEKLFDNSWLCYCGSRFVTNDTKFKYLPDRRCSSCGQLVDIKRHVIKNSDAVCISQIPFDKYPNELIIALWGGEYWLGNIKLKCIIKSGPHPPAHKDKGTYYYWIYLHNFKPLHYYLSEKVW